MMLIFLHYKLFDYNYQLNKYLHFFTNFTHVFSAYRTNEGKPWVLPVVKKVEKMLAADELQNHEYLPILGLDAFSQHATTMLLGNNSQAIAHGKAFGIQSLSGTGSLRVGAEFLARILHYDTFYYSKPTWGNYQNYYL